MEKIIMVIGKSKDFYGAASDNCDGIYAAGNSVEAVKADTYAAIEGIKRNLQVSLNTTATICHWLGWRR